MNSKSPMALQKRIKLKDVIIPSSAAFAHPSTLVLLFSTSLILSVIGFLISSKPSSLFSFKTSELAALYPKYCPSLLSAAVIDAIIKSNWGRRYLFSFIFFFLQHLPD